MDLDVIFLGTGGSVPTARRATACVVVRRGGDRLMFDCGEGSQRQMQRSTGLVELDEIYLTHYHADHYLGLPGLLKTYDLHAREKPLRIYGPAGLRDLFGALRRIMGNTRYELVLTELEPSESVSHDGYRVVSFPVRHRVKGYGYAIVEDERPGRFDPAAAERLGVQPGPDFGRLQRGEEVAGRDRRVGPDEVMDEARPGRKVVLSGDTTVCETTALAAAGAELLVHDASFTDSERERGVETGHATAREAAALAREAGAKMLALVHISSRYSVNDALAEAREEFSATFAPRDFDLVEIPFPERGAPDLVPNGARERPEPNLAEKGGVPG